MTDDASLPRRAFLATAAGLVLAPQVARAADVATVKIAGTNSESASNVFYALELGLFEKNGVRVDLQTFSNSGAFAAGIASGSFDLGVVSSGSIALAHEHGIPFVVLANGGLYSASSPTTYLCVAHGSPIRTAADFNGKTIAVSTLQDVTQVAVMGWLARNGGDYHQVNFVEIAPPTMVPALRGGRVDGAFIGEPTLITALDDLTLLAPAYDSVAPRFAIVGWVTSRSWLAANAAVAKRVQTAFSQASTWAVANRTQAGEILVKYTKVSPAIVQRMHHVDWAPGASASLLQPVVDAMARYGLIAKSYPATELLS